MVEIVKKSIPNILTALRVVAIPFFIVCALTDHTIIALFIFIGCCVTDYYDGYFARKWNIESNFGKLMDPLADKLLVISALIILNIKPIAYIHWLVTAIIALREVYVTIIRQYYQERGIIIAAKLFGKVKTGLQMGGIIGVLTFYSAFRLQFLSFLLPFKTFIIIFLQVYFWLVVGFTILSGIELLYNKEQK